MAKLIEEISEQPAVLNHLYQKYKNGILYHELSQKELFLIGTGASLSACLQAKYALMEYYKKTITVIPAFEADYHIPLLKPEHVIILVSQSGESYETHVVCDSLSERNIPFYALTNNVNSYLGKKARETYPLEAGVELGTATKTHTSSIMLFYLMAAAENEAALKEVAKIPESLQKTLEKAQKYISELASFIGEKKAIYITGLGKHAPTALQAGLMLKEKVFLHCEGLSLVEFRHGPVESIENGTPVIIIAIGEENRKAALLHADFLSRICGAKVAIVSDCEERTTGGYLNFPVVWDGEECFSHICATALFQLLAEYMAAQRGYDIDGFKFIGKILSKYKMNK
jgi:glucosamine--fructose-6-phosphate aminotransferase (isomerizing)